MRKLYVKILLGCLGIFGGGVMGQTATYTVISTSIVTTGGTSPGGSSANYSQTFGTAKQIVGGTSATLTLSGYAGYKITSIILEMKSNASSGAGTLSVVAGSTTISNIIPAANFNSTSWYGDWSTSYVNITKAPIDYDITTGQNVVITITGTTNSLYIQKYSINYEASCIKPTITSQPIDKSICINGSTTFTAATSAGSPTYQWQSSSNGSTGWADVVNNTPANTTYTNSTTASLTVSASTAISGYFYRCKITAAACDGFTNAAKLVVDQTPSVTTNPANAILCGPGNTNFTVAATGTNLTYQWEASNSATGPWANVSNGTPVGSSYSGNTAATLNVTGLNATYFYRSVVSNIGCGSVNSTAASGTVNPIPATPAGSITVSANPSCGPATLTYPGGYYWQTSNAGISTSSPTSAAYILNNTGIMYVRELSAGCWSPALATATITINTQPAIATHPISPAAVCASYSGNISVTASGNNLLYQWQSSNTNAGPWTNVINGNPASATYTGITGSTLNISSLTGTYYYRCVVSNGGCIAVNSNVATITVNALPTTPAGSLTAITNPSCGPTTINYSAYSGIEYWQTISNGTSVTNPVIASGNLSVLSSGNYYIKSRSAAGCWSNGQAGPLSVTINSQPNITTQPIDKTVTSPTGTTFTIVASNAAGYQWQRYNSASSAWVDLNSVVPYSNVTSATLNIATTTTAMDGNEYRCIVKSNAPCVDVYSSVATLFVEEGPCISEGFSSGTTPPSGWTFNIGGTYTTMGNFGIASPSLQFDLTNQRITTYTLGSFASQLSFWIKGQGTNATSALLIEGFNGVTWVTIQNLSNLPTTATTIIYNSSSSPALPLNINQFRFTYTKSTGNLALDDVLVSCTPPPSCTSTHTITSFNPTSGPAGTLVTITGTGFDNVNIPTMGAVKFGSISSTNYSIVDATTIIAEVPVGATIDKLSILKSSCTAKSISDFNVLTTSGTCGNGSGSSSTDVFISEIYDHTNGSLTYVELFNGTGAAIDLTSGAYSIRIKTNTTDNYYALTGTIASNATMQLKIGKYNSYICAVTATWDYPDAPGINGNDQIFLYKTNGTVWVDYAPNPNYDGSATNNGNQLVGFSQKRKASALAPNTIYNSNDWTVGSESCTNLGTGPFTVSAPAISISQQPADVGCNSTLTFTVNASGGTGIINSGPGVGGGYTWKFNNPATMTGWDNVSFMASSPYNLPVTVVGSGSNSITITGNTAILQDYQFYVEINTAGSPRCNSSSIAAQYKYDKRNFYQTVAGGDWNNLSIWEMSNDNINWVPVCNYPASVNSKEIVIRNHNVNLNIDNKVNKLTIEANGSLNINNVNKLDILNGVLSGADFILNGTLIDNGSSSNGLGFDGSSSWIMGSNATIIKTNTSSGAAYRDNYQGGISTIPSAANWIMRGNATTNVSFTTETGTTGSFPSASYYPNLTFESSTGLWNPAASTSRFSGSLSTATIKGNLDIGGTGGGTVNVYNENMFANPISILENVFIRSNNSFTNNGGVNIGTGLDIKGHLTVNGTLINNGGSTNKGDLIFTGSTNNDQIISGTGTMQLENVQINNTGSGRVLVDKDFGIPGKLSFGSSAAKLALNNGSVSLQSGNARTANVGVILPGTAITYPGAGRFITERYIKYTGNWNLITSPLAEAQSILDGWQEGKPVINNPGYGTQVTMPGTVDPSLDGPSTGYSIKWWDSDPFNPKFVGVDNTATTYTNQPSGFFAFVRGDRSIGPGYTGGPTILRSKGKIYIANDLSGIQPPVVSHFFGTSGQFFSVANPLASTINFSKVYTNNRLNNIKPVFHLWDPTVSGSYNVGKYQTFTDITQWTPTPAGGLYLNKYDSIQSGQAFYLESDINGETSILFNELDKADGSRTTMRGGGPETLSMMSTMLHNNTGYVTDGNRVVFDNAYSKAFAREDAKKITNSSENFGISIGNFTAIVEGRPQIAEKDTIFYKMSNLQTNNYKLSFEPRNLSASGLQAFLIDNFLNSSTPISLSDSTYYNFAATAVAASKAANRFMLVFKAAGAPLPVTLTQILAKRNNDLSITVTWKVEQEQQLSHYEVERSADGVQFTKLATVSATNASEYTQLDAQPLSADNYYRLKAVSQSGAVQYSRIVKVAPLQLISTMTVYPNPVVKHDLQLQLSSVKASSYKLQLYNNSGQQVFEKTLQVAAGSQHLNIALPKYLSKGNYRLSLQEPGGVGLWENVLLQ